MTSPRCRRWSIAVSTLAIVALAGCGAGSESPAAQVTAVACDIPPQNPPVTVNVLAYNSSAIDPFTNSMVSSCSKNGVTVAHAPIDFGGQYQKTATTLAGGTATYDIIEMYSGAVPRYGSTGKLLALNDLLAKYKDKYQLGDLSENMISGLSYQGKLYALPTQANVLIMVYRKDILDKAGVKPPTTYAELATAAQKIQATGMQYPIALPFTDSTSTLFEQTLASQGASYLNASGAPDLQSAPAKAGLTALTSLRPYMDPQVISFKQPAVQQQMFNGKAAIAMMFSGRMADLLSAKNTQYSNDFAFAAPPAVEAGGKPGAIVSVDGWSIPTNSTVSPDVLFQVAAASVGVDASKSALPAAYPARKEIATPQNVPYAAAVQAALQAGAATPPMETWLGSMQGATAPLFDKAISGQASVEDALSQAQAAAVTALKATS